MRGEETEAAGAAARAAARARCCGENSCADAGRAPADRGDDAAAAAEAAEARTPAALSPPARLLRQGGCDMGEAEATNVRPARADRQSGADAAVRAPFDQPAAHPRCGCSYHRCLLPLHSLPPARLLASARKQRMLRVWVWADVMDDVCSRGRRVGKSGAEEAAPSWSNAFFKWRISHGDRDQVTGTTAVAIRRTHWPTVDSYESVMDRAGAAASEAHERSQARRKICSARVSPTLRQRDASSMAPSDGNSECWLGWLL